MLGFCMTLISTELHQMPRKARRDTTRSGQQLRKHDSPADAIQRERHDQAALSFTPVQDR